MKKESSVYPVWIILTVTFVIIVLAFLLIFLLNYKTQKTAKGFEDEILVVADSLEYEQLQKSLQSVFEKEIFTPQPEKMFILKRGNISLIENRKRTKNIIIAATLNSASQTSNFIETIVDPSVEGKSASDTNAIYYKHDLWAKNQLVAVLSAPTIQELNNKILQNSDELFITFQKKSDERLFSNLYNPNYEQKEIEGKFLTDYGWIIYVQPDFKLVSNKQEEKFVMLKKSEGSELEHRIIIHWIDNAIPDYLMQDSIKALRNRLTKKFSQTSDDTSYAIVASDYFVVKEVNFNGRYALFTQGLWEMNLNGMSGPFVNYFFFDEKTKRIYMIDGSIYAPRHYKRNLIQQMDVTLQSFRTKSELTDERIKELTKAVKD
jgi:hypothetical protein